MKDEIKNFWLIILIFGSVTAVYADKSPLNDFYFVGEVPDSAAIGRGLAYTGVTGSPFAPYWNPAGLISMRSNSMGISLNHHSESDMNSEVVKRSFPLEGRLLNFISVCSEQVAFFWRPLSNRVDTSSWTVSGVNYEQTIDEKISVFGVSVAVPHSEKTDFGMNINFITGMLGYSLLEGNTPTVIISNGLGWGLDWGLLYKMQKGLSMGITLLNFPAQIYWEDFNKDKLPIIFRAGVDLQLTQLMSVGIDYENGIYDDSVKDRDIIHLGVEHYIKKSFLLRGGIYGSDFNDTYETVYTAGIGYRMGGHCIDMAVKQYYLNKSESGKLRRYSISGVIQF